MNVGNAPAAGKRRASGAAAEDRHAETIVVVERADRASWSIATKAILDDTHARDRCVVLYAAWVLESVVARARAGGPPRPRGELGGAADPPPGDAVSHESAPERSRGARRRTCSSSLCVLFSFSSS